LITETPPQIQQITSQEIAIGVRQNLMSWCPWSQVYVTAIVLGCVVSDLSI
jgi:hypothetical protein